MACARALPMIHLMPAVGSRQDPDATPPGVRRPGKNERPHPVGPACRAPHRSSCHRARRPWTQIRLGAGTRHHTRLLPDQNTGRRPRPEPHVFALVDPGSQHAADPRQHQGRSPSLRCGRSTLTPRLRSPRPGTGGDEGKHRK